MKMDEAFVYKNAWKYQDDASGADKDYLYFSGSGGPYFQTTMIEIFAVK